MRSALQPGDVGAVVQMHGLIYARERGWDHRFEAYVARALAEFALAHDVARERIWLAEDGDRIVGSIAILSGGGDDAQLRWFLVAPECRGAGAGSRLIDAALEFCRATGRRRVFLWTVRGLDAAAHLYARAGFRVTESVDSERWGPPVVEERWDLVLTP
ncbi:MAG TPA: GNAT family N-acetyltransferase [Longimicrobiales bacterium]